MGSGCVGEGRRGILPGVGGRVRVAVAALSLTVLSVLIPLPSRADPVSGGPGAETPAQFTDARRGRPIEGTDMVVPPAGTPALLRPGSGMARSDTPAIYDIHVFTMETSDGSVGLTDADLADMVARTDAWFARNTTGSYRFRLAGPVHVLPTYTGRVCDFTPAEEAVASSLPLSPSAGAVDAIWVVVTPEITGTCPAIGQGNLGAPGVWMMGMREPVHRGALLIHELGHNLGLGHSKAVVPAGTAASWPQEAPPELAEYGDALDFMGRDYSICTWQCTVVRPDIHAHNLNLLGVLPQASIAYVPSGDDTVVDLAPVDAEDGVRVLYVPWLNRSKFVLDYRPIDHHGGMANGPFGPGAGVVVRLVDSYPDFGPEPYAAGGGTAALSDPLLPPSGVIRIGVGAGGSRTLPDGTTVEVVRMGADGASVRVTRPADSAVPTVTPSWARDCSGSECVIPREQVLWETGRASYDLSIRASDDQWLKSLAVAVTGTITFDKTAELPGPGGRINALEGLSLSTTVFTGQNRVTVTATDLSGQQAAMAWNLRVPRPSPTNRWYGAGGGLSWNWMDYERLRCWHSRDFCVGVAVRADRACTRTVTARISSLAKDGSVIETQTVRLGPLPRGKSTALVASFTKDIPRVNSFGLTSLACSRR